MKNSLRIIVADDEPLLVEELTTYLVESGHKVIATVASGIELVAKTLELHPDLIVTDIKMPGMDGLEAVKRITGEYPVPVVIVSAYHDDDFIHRANEQCVMSYIVKPVDEASLKTSVALAMRRFDEFQALRKENSDLKQALEDRKAIERAKGLLMKRAKLTEEEAFLRLQKLSRDKGTKMTEIARTILAAEEVYDA